jgi:hypothetical protein
MSIECVTSCNGSRAMHNAYPFVNSNELHCEKLGNCNDLAKFMQDDHMKSSQPITPWW